MPSWIHHSRPLFALGFVLLLLPACATNPNPGRPSAPPPDRAARQVEAHTRFLADDLLEGRRTGTRGYDLAAHYVAAQFRRLGLEPVGEGGGYLQPLTVQETTDDLEAGQLLLQRGGEEVAFDPVGEVLVRAPAGRAAGEVTAPAAFVGFGVHAPDLGYDDFGDIDLRGKIAVVLSGAPPAFAATQRAHYSSGTEKAIELVRRGAVGVLTIVTPRDEARFPWALNAAQARFPRMKLLDAQGVVIDGFPELRATATMSRSAAERLFQAAGRSAAEVFSGADRSEPQYFSLDFDLALAGRATVRQLESMNVVGLRPGADAALAATPLVITAHLDHLGIGAAVDGDVIYNGAIDNAVGVGLLLAAAEALANEPAPRRPIVFAALTAEEQGLLGAEFLARNPPAGVRRFAANINLDMALFMAPVRDILAWGAEHSSLGRHVEAAAAQGGFTVSPDPVPDEVIFVRSDQYAFVRTGVPALLLGTGQASADPTVNLAEAWSQFLRHRYHKPIDDLAQPIHWPSVEAFARFCLSLTRAIADDGQAPSWNENDFFGRTFEARDLGPPERDRAAGDGPGSPR